jgi:hypothetical protein
MPSLTTALGFPTGGRRELSTRCAQLTAVLTRLLYAHKVRAVALRNCVAALGCEPHLKMVQWLAERPQWRQLCTERLAWRSGCADMGAPLTRRAVLYPAG